MKETRSLDLHGMTKRRTKESRHDKHYGLYNYSIHDDMPTRISLALLDYFLVTGS